MHFKISLELARRFSKMVAGRKLTSAIPSLMSEWRNTNVQSLTHTLDVKRRVSLNLFKIFYAFFSVYCLYFFQVSPFCLTSVSIKKILPMPFEEMESLESHQRKINAHLNLLIREYSSFYCFIGTHLISNLFISKFDLLNLLDWNVPG